MYRKQTGFTIVELVVVIILLGILAATALPRFINIEDDAHEAAFEGVVGSVQTGIALFHAKTIASQAATNDQILEFSNLRVNPTGYPYGVANRGGGTSTVTAVADCAAVFSNVQQAGAPTVTTGNATNIAARGAAGGGFDYVAVVTVPNCTYWYTGQSTTSGDLVWTMTYDSVSGQITTAQQNLP